MRKDTVDMSTQGITRIKVNNYPVFGQQIIRWSRTPEEQRPKTIGAVKEELKAVQKAQKLDEEIIKFPRDRLSDSTPVTFVESKVSGEWLVRLPPIEMVDETLARLRDGRGYPVEHLPDYYYDYLCKDRDYDEEFLYSRICDYVIAQCA